MQYLIPVAVIKNPEGKILFIKKSIAKSEVCINRWELPGGTVPFGVTFKDALKEKIKDYLGIDIEVGTIIPQVATHVSKGLANKDGEIQFFVIGAFCSIIGDSTLTLKQGKISDATWLSIEEFNQLPEDERVPGDLEILKTVTL